MSIKPENDIFSHAKQIFKELRHHLIDESLLNDEKIKDDNSIWRLVENIINVYWQDCIKTPLDEQAVQNFIRNYREPIQEIIDQAKLAYGRKLKENEEEIKYNNAVAYTRYEILSRIPHHQKKQTLNEIRAKFNVSKKIEYEDLKNIYEEYSERWNEYQAIKNAERYIIDIANTDTFDDVLNKFVIEHADDELLSIEEFEQLIHGWPKSRKTLEECYKKYRELYFK